MWRAPRARRLRPACRACRGGQSELQSAGEKVLPRKDVIPNNQLTLHQSSPSTRTQPFFPTMSSVCRRSQACLACLAVVPECTRGNGVAVCRWIKTSRCLNPAPPCHPANSSAGRAFRGCCMVQSQSRTHAGRACPRSCVGSSSSLPRSGLLAPWVRCSFILSLVLRFLGHALSLTCSYGSLRCCPC